MPSIKDYNDKLKSLSNTKKITKTMKMVSASKLRKAHEAQIHAKQYAQLLSALIARISTNVRSADHPLFQKRKEEKNVLILILTSDRGLCAGFNDKANKKVKEWIDENQHKDHNIVLSFCGKKGYDYFQKTLSVDRYYEGITVKPKFSDGEAIGNDLILRFNEHRYDAVYITYNQFFSPLTQETIIEKILPLNRRQLVKANIDKEVEYIFEPDREDILSFLIPHYFYFKIYFALLENAAGEHGARMTAMDSAFTNASELIDTTTLLRNRARQAAITTELSEIIAGAEALK